MADPRLGAYNIEDLRQMARKIMPHGIFEYLDRGTEDEVSLRHNRDVFERIRFKPRSLVDISKRSQAITLFGKTHKMPVMIGPTGFGGLCAYQGDVLLARAAAAAGVPFALSTGSVTAMEKVVAEGGGTLWFQLYMWPDRRLSHGLVKRAEAAGFEALIVTIDVPVSGNREFSLRSGFTKPFTLTRRNSTDVLMHPRWFAGVLLRYMMTEGMPRQRNFPPELQSKITAAPMGFLNKELKADSLSWDDLRGLRKIWSRPLIVKGILNAKDAAHAADCGADGIIISNHGGRNLDGAVSPMEVLPEIVDAVGHRITVLIDSGFRRGTDVVKALALGAKAILLGRAPLYGLPVAGEAGAARALTIFREEIDRVMGLTGCNTVADANLDILKFDT